MHSILFRFGLCWITIATISGDLSGFSIGGSSDHNGHKGRLPIEPIRSDSVQISFSAGPLFHQGESELTRIGYARF